MFRPLHWAIIRPPTNDTEETLPKAYRAWNHPVSSYSHYTPTPLVHNHTHFTYTVLISAIAYDLVYNTSFSWHLSMVTLPMRSHREYYTVYLMYVWPYENDETYQLDATIVIYYHK